MESVGLLLCPKQRTTGHFLESDEPISYPHVILLKIKCIIVLPSTHRSSKWSYFFGVSNQNLYALFFLCVLYMYALSSSPLHRPWFEHPVLGCSLFNLLWSLLYVSYAQMLPVIIVSFCTSVGVFHACLMYSAVFWYKVIYLKSTIHSR